jgi:hypothetical protein
MCQFLREFTALRVHAHAHAHAHADLFKTISRPLTPFLVTWQSPSVISDRRGKGFKSSKPPQWFRGQALGTGANGSKWIALVQDLDKVD